MSVFTNPPYLTMQYVNEVYDRIQRELQGGVFKLQWQGKFDMNILTVFTTMCALQTSPEECRRYLCDVIDSQRKSAWAVYKNITPTIKWITTTPGTQLTSSFNPIIEDPKEWYGEYMIEK